MLQKQLRQHQWKAFRRNPMFERNLAVRIFMYLMFGLLAIEFLGFGFFLDTLLLKAGTYELAIDTFNSLLPFIFVADFVIKFFFKTNHSMQIAPYLSLPIKRNRLFDFLLRKEFTSFWNFYFFFLVVPFAFKAITPFFGFPAAMLYILFFYLLCILNSLWINIINNLLSKSFLYYILPALWVVFPFFLIFGCKIDLGDYSVRLGEMFLNYNLLIYIAFIVFFVALWFINRVQMRERLYNEMQGEKIEKISSFSSLSFLNRFGVIGDFINLELRMILRSPRLKQQIVFAGILIICLFFYMLYEPNNPFTQRNDGKFIFFLYGIFNVGLMGIIMGQYLFTSESSFFDGLASRKASIFDMLKSKYILYSSYSLLVTLLLLIPAFQGKISAFLLVSLFFYVIGPIYFIIFQNAVYNKTYFDIFDKGMWNWKGQSGNMLVITLITMFVPVIFVLILNIMFGNMVAYSFMLIVGLAFTFASKYWLAWTYNRFLKRKYRNMEGFRAN
ncbi:MAG: DUF5687 family protein [Dysgonamonadaceae bacterium]|jgi:hypothetical protein|nr:DUF5687 family protein [Dysgonamonadaceae bacterium]